jgi:hypothetical protein
MPKPGKDPKRVTSYRSLSLLLIIAKLLGKLILRRMDPGFSTNDWIPHHQFGFHPTHSKIQQCHHITHTVLTAARLRDLYLTTHNAYQ